MSNLNGFVNMERSSFTLGACISSPCTDEINRDRTFSVALHNKTARLRTSKLLHILLSSVANLLLSHSLINHVDQLSCIFICCFCPDMLFEHLDRFVLFDTGMNVAEILHGFLYCKGIELRGRV